MFKLSLKWILSNKSRTICTISGFFLATVMVMLGVYYLHVSNSIAEENFDMALSEQRILIEQVQIAGFSYLFEEEGAIELMNPIRDNMISDILASDGVRSICVQYENILPDVEAWVGEKKLLLDSKSIAVDPQYEIFSDALVNSIKKSKEQFVPVIAGEVLSGTDPMQVMISETTVAVLGLTPESVIGMTLDIPDLNGHAYKLFVCGVYAHELTGYYREKLSNFENSYHGGYQTEEYGIDFLFHSDFFKMVRFDAGNTEWMNPSFVNISMSSLEGIELLAEKLVEQYSQFPLSDYLRYYNDIEKRSAQASMFLVLGGIILLLSILLICNTMFINITQQERFLRILRLMGYTKARIHMLHVCQSFIYGLLGSGAGCVLSYIGCTILGMAILGRFEGVSIDASVFVLPIQYPICILLVLLVVNMLLGYVTSVGKLQKLI